MNASFLQPIMDSARLHFGDDIRICISAKLDLDKDGDKFVPENPKYNCYVSIDGQYFWGDNFDECLDKAKSGYVVIDKARKEAAKKLQQQAEAILAGSAPIPAS